MTAAKTYTFTIEGQPVPKERPRFSKGRIYTPAKTAAAEEAIAWEIKKQIKKPLEDDMTILAAFFCKGNKHGDLDNFLKLLLDAANGVAFKDDRQVKKIMAEIFYSNEPKTIFLIRPIKELN